MSVNVNYKGSLLTTISNGSTKTLNTSGKYMEDNVQIVDTVTNGSAFPPAVTITKAPTFSMNSSTGVITASYAGSSSITPTVNAGYISQGTAGTISTTGTSTYTLPTQGAQTITPGSTARTIASNRWLTGTQTIAGDSNLVANNIAEGVSIFGVTGTHSGGGGSSDAEDAIVKRTISGTYENSRVSTIGSYAFYYCSRLTTASFPNATAISNSAFYYCYSLTTVSFPNVTTIGNSAFYYCSRLTTASFPSATAIGGYAFAYCSGLTTVSFPNVTTIGSYAFASCYSLTTASFPNATLISNDAFYYCYRLTTVSFPNATLISNNAFYYCSNLTTVSFPNATSIGNSAFAYCSTLTTVSFPNVTTIGSYAFRGCCNLISAIFLASSVASLGVSAFYSTPIAGYTVLTGGVYGSIYVPASLYDSYITATNWAVYSERIVSV